MTAAPFAVEAVRRALRDADLASVEVVETFPASSAEVARLRVRFSDGRDPITVIGKRATGPGLAAARRELRFFEQLAPLWPHPAPALLGAWGDGAELLLVTEDLGAAGYAPVRDGVSAAQLDAVVDTLVELHARFWDDLPIEILDARHPAPSASQSAQAWPPEVVARHAIAARGAVASFVAAVALTEPERALLHEVTEHWEARILARARDGRAVTLIHGDFHLLGNVFFAPHAPRPRVIDWSELKPGLGPHDLAYCLHMAPSDDRPARDGALLRRYWEGLAAAGVVGYRWELCQWDYQFSLITNLFQAAFQRSAFWFRNTAALIAALDGRAALHRAPPID